MARTARKIELSPEVRRELEAAAWSESQPFRAVLRARLMLLAAGGATNEAIAGELGITPQVVCKWRRRFAPDPRPASLVDARRSGRPARVPLTARCEVIRLACERPNGEAVPFREVWTQQALAKAATERTGVPLCRSEVRRKWLGPHTVRQWLHSQDPEFASKVTLVCDLYTAPPNAHVILCIDEKPVQILARLHPTKRDAKGSVPYKYEYRGRVTSVLSMEIHSMKIVAPILAATFGVLIPRAGHCDGWDHFDERVQIREGLPPVLTIRVKNTSPPDSFMWAVDLTAQFFDAEGHAIDTVKFSKSVCSDGETISHCSKYKDNLVEPGTTKGFTIEGQEPMLKLPVGWTWKISGTARILARRVYD